MQELHTQAIPDVHSAEAEAQVERKLSSEAKLDALIGGALDEAEKPSEFEDFVASRPYRKELSERHGADAASVVDRFKTYSDDLRINGALAGEKIAGDYYAGTNMAKLLHVAEKESAASAAPSVDKDESEHHWKKLDRILEKNIDEVDARASDMAEFEAAKEKFAALKAENPSLTWQEFFKTTTNTDRALFRDPNFAYRLVAASGVAVTELQGEMAKVQAQQSQELGAINGLLSDMANRGELVQLDRHATAMAQIWQDPNFRKSGDLRTDVRTANQIAERYELYRLQEIERQSAVEKARRASPVRAVGGMSVAAAKRGGGLDASLSAALAHMPDD
jgi:hypothetical protein